MIKTPRSIAVVGGGTAGFVAALILKRRFPQMRVDVIRSSKIGIIGVGEGSTEHWSEMMKFLNFNHHEIIQECDATYKTGIMFQNWGAEDYLHSIQVEYSKQKGQYYHVYGKLIGEGVNSKGLGSRHIWDNNVNTWFLNKPDQSPSNQYHFNTHKLNTFLTNKATKAGITIYDDEILDFDIKEDGDIGTLFGNKQKYTYDFYIDCTGFKKLLISKLGSKWQSYSKYLKMNSAIAFPTGDTDNYNMWTIARAMDAGWLFRLPVWGRHGNGYIFDSNHISVEAAKLEAEKYIGHEIEIGKHITFDPGALDRVWINNCCAIGLSSSFVEPLEASSIGTSIQQSFLLMHRIVNYDQATIKSYNKDVNDILTNIRDFVALHYATKRNDTSFWKEIQTVELPDSLQEKLEVWKNHLPIKEDFNGLTQYALFSDAHYLFILQGLGLFNIDSIKKEFEAQDILIKNEADGHVRDAKLQQDTISVLSHKQILSLIRAQANGQR